MKTGKAKLLVLLFTATLLPIRSEGRPVVHTVLQQTRTASVVAIVETTEVHEKAFSAAINRILKGGGLPETISMYVDEPTTIETSTPTYQRGQCLLLFFKRAGDRPQLLFGSQSAIPLSAENCRTHAAAVQQILEFEAARTTTERGRVLQRILASGNAVGISSALTIIYLQPDSIKPAPELEGTLLSIAKSQNHRQAVPAIQALGKIGTDDIVDPLIQLMVSPDQYVSETAALVVRQRMRFDFPFDPAASVAEKAKKAKQVTRWWERLR